MIHAGLDISLYSSDHVKIHSKCIVFKQKFDTSQQIKS